MEQAFFEMSEMKYHGPKERLEAAKSKTTSPEELAELANSEYVFVKAAVAANPHTFTETLVKLIPSNLSDDACQIILGLLSNRNFPPDHFSEITALIESSSHGISPRDYYQNEVLKKLASSSTAPLISILPLANPSTIPKHLRSRISNTETRPGLLEKLVNDPSEKVSEMAAKALNQLNKNKKKD